MVNKIELNDANPITTKLVPDVRGLDTNLIHIAKDAWMLLVVTNEWPSHVVNNRHLIFFGVVVDMK